MNVPQIDDDGDDLPLLEDVEGAVHRRFYARAVGDGAAIRVSTQVVLAGAYVMSAERLVDNLTVEEAVELHAALAAALAARDTRAVPAARADERESTDV